MFLFSLLSPCLQNPELPQECEFTGVIPNGGDYFLFTTLKDQA